MYFSATTMITTISMLRAASAAPLVSRQVCGAAPTGTNAQTPLLQPTGITTASACGVKCTATTNCQSFLFGLVNEEVKCELFSVPASSLPPQTNLVAYDIDCASIPSVIPTTANPGGLATGTSLSGSKKEGRQAPSSFGTHDSPKNAQPAGNPTPIATPQADSLAECLASCKGSPQCVNYTFESGVCKLFAATSAKPRRQQIGSPSAGSNTGSQPNNSNNGNAQQGTHDNPVNAIPAGSPSPIATPA
ncbi:hypothetical protein B0O99DRAFT_603326, partial [Bisporella sp. PMI_857]